MLDVRRPLSRLGHNFLEGLWRVGTMARFFGLVLASSATSFLRFRLVMREVYFSGVLSLIIIIVSGLFIGMVLGLQGFQTLQEIRRDRIDRRVGGAFAHARTRPGGLRDPLRGASGLRDHRRNRAHEDHRAAHGHGHDGRGADGSRHRPSLLGGHHLHADPVAALLAMGVFGGYIVAWSSSAWDNGAFWSQMQAAVEFRYDVLNGLLKAFVFGIAVTVIATFEGYDAPPTARAFRAATTRTVVTSALMILALDLVLTAFMLHADG